MRTRLPRFLRFAALAILAATAVPAFADGEPLSREFPDHNFKWSIPGNWAFEDPSDEDAAAGFVVRARRVLDEGREVMVYVSVREAGTTTVAQNLAQVKENKAKALQEVEAKAGSGPWAGLRDAGTLRVMGKASNGSTVAWFVFAGIVGGKYTQMDVRSVNGAHHDLGPEINRVVGGFEFLEGVAAPAEGEPGATPEAPSVPDTPGGEAPPPSEGGPPKKRFEKLGLTWALPDLPPLPPPPEPLEGQEPKKQPVRKAGFTGEGNADLGKLQDGLLGRAVLLWDDVPVLQVLAILPKAALDASAVDVVKNEGNFEGLKNEFESSPIPNVDEDTPIGNVRGAHRTLSGKGRDGRPLWIRTWFVTVQQQLYMIRAVAEDRAEQEESEWLKGVLRGFIWDDTKSGVRGPWAVPFRSMTEPRGTEWQEFGKKAKFERSTVELTKPPQFGGLKFTPGDGALAPWLYAAEARDGELLLFFGLQRFDAGAFKDFAEIVDDLENDWRNTFDEAVTRPKSEKTNRQASAFKGAKGWSFEFRGKKEGHPFVQKGWVVRQSSNVFVVRGQFGGEGAEKALGDDFDSIAKSIRFK